MLLKVPACCLSSTSVCILEGLCIWLVRMLSTMNYMLTWAHPGLANVMLSGVIKIFCRISKGGGDVSDSGLKRFMALVL